MAGAAHFDSLRNAERVAGCKFAVLDEVCAERACCGACGGIFVKFPGEHAASESFVAAGMRKAIGHRRVFSEEAAKFADIHFDFGECGAILGGNHQIEDASGNAFRIEVRVEVFCCETKRLRKRGLFYFRRFEDGFGLCHGDAIGAAVLETNFDGENAGARLLHDVNAAFLCGDDAKFGEKEPGTDDGMAGELQLLLRGEDAEASERAIVSRFLDEDCFGVIHFARNDLHLIVGEAVAVGENGERIAFEAIGGEDVECKVAVLHSGSLKFVNGGDNCVERAARCFFLVGFGINAKKIFGS